MSLRERLEWLMRMALLVFILAAAAFLSAITAIRFAIHGREVEMPSLAGKSARDAQSILAGRSLSMRVADRAYSDLAPGQVVRQSPPAGTHMKASQQAQVVLSLGQRVITIPELESKSSRAARIVLLRSGLQVGEISGVYLPEYESDAVIQQNPRPGGGAASPRVNLLVSQGAREPAYIMPFLVGLNQADAQRQLAAAGLHMKINAVLAPEWPHGAVIDQKPAAGSRITSSTVVELQVGE